MHVEAELTVSRELFLIVCQMETGNWNKEAEKW